MLIPFILALLTLVAFTGMGPLFATHAFNRAHWKVPAYNLWSSWTRLLLDCTGGNRSALKPLLCQLNAGVLVAANFLGAGAAIWTPSDGDPNSLWWKTVTRQAAGKFTLTTKDPWLAIDFLDANYGAATLTNFWIFNFGIPSKNTDNTWSVTVQVYSAAGGAAPALTDPILADVIFICAIFRNSLLNP